MISVFAILPSLANGLDRILVQNSVGFDKLAIYNIGLMLGVSLNSFFQPFILSVAAKLVHRTPDLQHYLVILVAGSLLGFMLSLAMPFVVPFLYGNIYTESVPLSIIVLSSMGIYFVRELYFNFLIYNKDKKLSVVYASNISASTLTILYMATVAILVVDSEFMLLWMAGAYPLQMFLLNLSLYVFSRAFS